MLNERDTKDITEAFKANDHEMLEKAMREYANEDEQVTILGIENNTDTPFTLVLEPWADELLLNPNERAKVYLCELRIPLHKDDPPFVSFGGEYVTVTASTGSTGVMMKQTHRTSAILH